jgi:hypothetical protein
MATPRSLAMNLGNKRLQERFDDTEITGQNVGARLAEKAAQGRQQFSNMIRQSPSTQINQILSKNREATQNWNRVQAMQQGQGNNMTMQPQGYGGATGDPRPGEGAQRRRAQGRRVPGPSMPPPQARPLQVGSLPQAGPPQIAEQGPTPSYASQAPMGSAMPNFTAQAQNPFAAAMTQVGLLNQTNTGRPQRMGGNINRPDFTYGLNPTSPMWQGPYDRANDPFNYYWDSPFLGRGNVLPQFQGLPESDEYGPFANEGVARQWPGWEMTPEVMSGLMQQYGNPMAAKGQISPMDLKRQHGVMPFESSGWPSVEAFTQQGLQQPMPTPFGVPWRR